MNRLHPKGYKNPQQIKAIKAKQKTRDRPVASYVSDAEAEKHFQKARIELMNNIPTKSDSNKVVKAKRKRHAELTKTLAKFNQL